MHFDSVIGFVTDDQERVQQILQDYNPNLVILKIPPALQETQLEKDKPFRIVCKDPRGDMYVEGVGKCHLVMDVRHDEMDQRLIAKIFSRDVTKNDPKDILKRIQAEQAAQKLYDAYKLAEKKQALADVHLSILKSPLHTYRHNGKVYR